MTTNIPQDLKYTKSHEWARQEDDGNITIGITDHAQSLLGDLVFVELPQLETQFGAGDESSVVESVKAASDVYCPIAGEIIAVNTQLEQQPDLINTDPYGEGWLFKLKPNNENALENLLAADEYQAHIETEHE